MKKDILIYGGAKDFNILNLLNCLKKSKCSYQSYLHNAGHPIDFFYDLQNNILKIDGIALEIKAMFMRLDIFSYLDKKDENLRFITNNTYSLLKQYLLFNEHIKIFNRQSLRSGSVNKIFNLLKAQEIGFVVPKTLISSNQEKINDFVASLPSIQKPIDGGDYAKLLTSDILERYHENFDMPHLVQEKMNQPEIRVYRVGEAFLSFHIQYDGLDYRAQQQDKVKVELVDNDTIICDKLKKLTEYLGLNYAAADFMTNNDGVLTFLEVNSAPMFARFNMASDDAIVKAIMTFLLD